MPLRLAEGLVRPDIHKIQLHGAHGTVFIDLRRKCDVNHITLRYGSTLRVGREEDRAPGIRALGKPQAQMLAAADLRQLRDMQSPHAQDRTRTTCAAGLQIAQRLNILDGQQFRRNFAVDGKCGAARVRFPETRAQGHHLFPEGRDALAPDGKAGGKFMPAVAFE